MSCGKTPKQLKSSHIQDIKFWHRNTSLAHKRGKNEKGSDKKTYRLNRKPWEILVKFDWIRLWLRSSQVNVSENTFFNGRETKKIC